MNVPGVPGASGSAGWVGFLLGGAAGVGEGAAPAAFSSWGTLHIPHHPPRLPLPPPISDCACSHQPAGAGALRTPGAPICALQIPRNVKLGGKGGEKQKLGASHPFRNLRISPVLRGPAGTQTTPPPPPLSGGDFVCVPPTFASLFIPLSYQVSHPPLAPKARVSLSRSPPLSTLPVLTPSCVSEAPTTFCVVLHGFAVMEKVETQRSPKLDPRGQADRSKDRQSTGGAAKGGQRQQPSGLQSGPVIR